VYNNLGDVWLLKGNKKAAIRYFMTTLEIHPDNKYAMDKLKQLKEQK